MISKIILLATGVFLALDGWLFHGLIFNYNVIGLNWLDPYVNHLYIGVAFVLIAAYEIYRHRKKG